MPGPSKQVSRRLSRDALDDAIDEAQSDGAARLVRRLCLIGNLYAGDTLSEAAARVGVSQPTASRWVERWNEGGVDGLRPAFGGGRPSKLDDRERAALATVLARNPSLDADQVRSAIEGAFGVSYSRRHVSRLIDDLRARDAPSRPPSGGTSDAVDALERRLAAELDALADH